MLEEKIREWKRTKSVALATEICEMLAKIYDDDSELYIARTYEDTDVETD